MHACGVIIYEHKIQLYKDGYHEKIRSVINTIILCKNFLDYLW